MKKEKFHIEYIFEKISQNSLWNRLATPNGLAEWFADSVRNEGKIFSFYWDDYLSEAELIEINPPFYVRFRWLEEDTATYFEFNLQKEELTGSLMLEITDFAEENEKEEAIILWNTQIKTLKRKLGL
jgi:uncharacterized protein YndB with AHSA1/START domain